MPTPVHYQRFKPVSDSTPRQRQFLQKYKRQLSPVYQPLPPLNAVTNWFMTQSNRNKNNRKIIAALPYKMVNTIR